ncbi:MAG: hypothetical protein P8M34_04540 [Saprospiraceae bacterium]|nr:hypothetical protein [Saprospiraceae bacterium]|tara:strand:- start:1257 stop:1454 length:198 start_codon:yes stop_codon:yes gene_type:complete
MSKNVFKELQKELESKFTTEKDANVKMRVKGSMGGLMFIADIFELFLTKFISVLLGKGADHSDKK